MGTLNLLAMDLGASNGRGMIGKFDGEKLELSEIHRFENNLHNLNGKLHWDVLQLFWNVKLALSKQAATGESLDGMGIDTWGVDYGLLDKQGQLLGNVVSYRESKDSDMEAVWEHISRRQLFERTGIASLNYNTLFQLFSRKINGDKVLENADTMLMLPDLLAYFLTGEKTTEYTNCTTTMLMNQVTKDWDWDIVDRLGLPRRIFTKIQPACSSRGYILKQVEDETGCGRIPFFAVSTHDTASAVAAVPAIEKNYAYLSSGTWSLLGIETNDAIVNDAVYEANFSHEGNIQGGYMLLKNIMGLALIQQCRREWLLDNPGLSWDRISGMAKAEKPFQSLINPGYSGFFVLEQMQDKVRNFCANTNQHLPETIGEFARCIYESLALKYRWCIDRLEKIKDDHIEVLHVVGGGSKDTLLNQFTANAIGRPVIVGPVESASIGNILSQVVAMGELKGIDEMRQVVRNSFDLKVYYPKDTQKWQEAYGRFLNLIDMEVDT